jgi:hypothetical protein
MVRRSVDAPALEMVPMLRETAGELDELEGEVIYSVQAVAVACDRLDEVCADVR